MRYVLANWKMYNTLEQSVALFQAIQEGIYQRVNRSVALPLPILCPPFVSLAPLRARAEPSLVALGAQNCHWELEGPYTGEISAEMLRGLADYVLLGHREQRAAGDTDEQIARKAAAASACGIVPILFVGEESPGDDPVATSEQRLNHAVSRLDLAKQHVLVVYEPAWAIGATQPADADQVEAVARQLKARLQALGTSQPEVLYGGTVNDDTIDQFARVGVLDGVGATRAALDAEAFLAIVDRVAAHSAAPCPLSHSQGS